MNHIKVRQLRFVDISCTPKRTPVYTLTNIKQEPCIHSPITAISTLLHMVISLNYGRFWGSYYKAAPLI